MFDSLVLVYGLDARPQPTGRLQAESPGLRIHVLPGPSHDFHDLPIPVGAEDAG